MDDRVGVYWIKEVEYVWFYTKKGRIYAKILHFTSFIYFFFLVRNQLTYYINYLLNKYVSIKLHIKL